MEVYCKFCHVHRSKTIIHKFEEVMKEYIDKIESILGISLIKNEIQSYNFTDNKLEELIDFATNYAGNPKKISNTDSLTCFLSLADISSYNFNVYNAGGSLGDHWPDSIEITNSLLFNDKVLIHDHLEHYAKSSLSGYVIGHRYDGIKNWLTALADWRDLILKDIICIIPQDLSYSPAINEIWEDELFDFSKILLSDFDRKSAELIDEGYEEDCIIDLNEIAYILASLSISKGESNSVIPFINSGEINALYRNILSSFINIASQQYMPGKEPGKSANTSKEFRSTIELKSNLNYLTKDGVDISKIFQLRKNFEDIRSEIKEILNLISSEKIFDQKEHQKVNDYFKAKEIDWNLRLSEIEIKDGSISKEISLGFTTCQLPGITKKRNADYHNTYQAIFEAYNNTSRSLLKDVQMLNYYFAVL